MKQVSEIKEENQNLDSFLPFDGVDFCLQQSLLELLGRGNSAEARSADGAEGGAG